MKNFNDYTYSMYYYFCFCLNCAQDNKLSLVTIKIYIYLLGLTISFEAKKMLPGCPRGLMENVDLRPNNYIEK